MTATDRRLGVSGSAAFKLPCRVATTANITLSGLQTIDGVALAADDRVLVKNQTTASENGIYVADTSTWQRAIDFDGPRDCVQGTLVMVTSGTVGASTVFQLSTASPVIGTSSLTWTVTGSAALALASAFMLTVLDDTTAAAAAATLGVYTTAQADAADAVVAAASIAKSLLTTRGDMIRRNATVPERLALGASGKVMASDGTDAGWAWAIRGVSQTVQGGPVTTAGLPDFLPATDADLNLVSQNVTSSYPLAVAAANGFANGGPVGRIGTSTANLTWTGLTASRAAATPNFLYVTVNDDGTLTTGFTIVAPVYQWGGTPATTSGLFTFNISEMKGYLGNGATAPQTNLVMVGEAATDGTGVISTVAYAYNGRYDSGYTSTLPSASTPVSKNHNLGIIPLNTRVGIQCTTTDAGYSVGEEEVASRLSGTDASNPRLHSCVSGRNTMTYTTTVSTPWVIQHKSTEVATALTAGSWKYRLLAERGW